MTDIVRWLRDSQQHNEKLRTTVSGASEAAEFYQRAADEIERLRVDVEQRLLVLEAKNTRIDALSSELANAREVLLEMDKIVAGHVDEAERLRLKANILAVELKKSNGLERMRMRENTELRALNAEMLATLKDAVRYLEYLNGETGGMFIGPGMPADALAQTRAVIAKAEGQS